MPLILRVLGRSRTVEIEGYRCWVNHSDGSIARLILPRGTPSL